VLAAPEDLPEVMRYNDAVKYIAKLKNWYGHDGAKYRHDRKLNAALTDGSYTGGWVIPTCEILYGDHSGRNQELITPDNILAHKDRSSFKGTFKMAASIGFESSDWYWSSSETQTDAWMLTVRLSDGKVDVATKEYECLSCRPVRLVPV